MNKTGRTLLDLLSGQEKKKVPVWLMRQAGRYLPEYRELRKQADSFIDFCLTPDMAAEATLQPLKRFDLDAAILFADILLIPLALGQAVTFAEGEGPRLPPLGGADDIEALSYNPDRLLPVYETIGRVLPSLSPTQTMIGFCGAPWTVACYMIEGKGRRDFTKAKEAALNYPALLDALLRKIEKSSVDYLVRQRKAGVHVVQLFESHAGQLSGAAFERFVIEPTARIVEEFSARCPDCPVIGFPRGAEEGDRLAYAQKTFIHCLGIDSSVSLSHAKEILAPLLPLQGNLSPELLLQGGEPMEEKTREILDVLAGRLIFNLGHGVIKETPPAHVEALIRTIRRWEKENKGS